MLDKDSNRFLLVKYPNNEQLAPELYWIRWANTEKLEIGQKVMAILNPGIDESFPVQVTAKKIIVDQTFEDKKEAVRLAISMAKELSNYNNLYVEKITVEDRYCTISIGEILSQEKTRNILEVKIDLKSNQVINE